MGDFQDKNSENLDGKKDPNSYQVSSTCTASQTSFRKHESSPRTYSGATHISLYVCIITHG